MNKLSQIIFNFINAGGWRSVIIVGIVGIVMAFTGMYLKFGFNWLRFVLVDIPLFCLCRYASYNVYKLISNHKNIFK